MSADYLRPDRKILKHGDNLPHWQQGEVAQFVTFRLGDALPKEKVKRYTEQRKIWLLNHPQPWLPAVESMYHQKFTWRLERWLDQGSGACLLEDPSAREALVRVLMRFDGVRVRHHSWVIMPNHVHLLFTPLHPLEKLIQSWKANSATHIAGKPIWQRNYRDTLIRDHEHFINALRYIRKNPIKANLTVKEFTLYESEQTRTIP
jgi:REP element-mobilizing transposase RayT